MQTVARRWALLFIACGILTLAVALSSVRQHSMSGSGMFIESKYQIVCPHISAVSFRKSFEACEFECGETQHRAHSCRRVAMCVGGVGPSHAPSADQQWKFSSALCFRCPVAHCHVISSAGCAVVVFSERITHFWKPTRQGEHVGRPSTRQQNGVLSVSTGTYPLLPALKNVTETTRTLSIFLHILLQLILLKVSELLVELGGIPEQ